MLKYDFILLICLWCGGKIGSFGFACVSACGRGKAKCANVGWRKIELKKSAVGKNKKYRRVGNECRVTRYPVALSLLNCHASKWLINCLKE